jgi:hypothetical protein
MKLTKREIKILNKINKPATELEWPFIIVITLCAAFWIYILSLFMEK